VEHERANQEGESAVGSHSDLALAGVDGFTVKAPRWALTFALVKGDGAHRKDRDGSDELRRSGEHEGPRH
jgi:hypothetical protein